MKYKSTLLSLLLLVFLTACSDDDNDTGISNDFVVAFENSDFSFTNSDSEKEINLVFSEEASQNGTLSIIYTETNLSYGTDFTTIPAANNGVIEISIEAGTVTLIPRSPPIASIAIVCCIILVESYKDFIHL